MHKLRSGIILLAVAIGMMLPIIVNPSIFVNRGNDLQEFFLPLYLYTKNHLLHTSTLPLWNTMYLSGVPLLPDPQAPLFYLPNILFLFFPVEIGFIVSSLLHITLGGMGMYLLTKRVLKCSTHFSLFAGSLYILAPRLSAFIEAGHFGLIAATAWIPFVALFTYRLIAETKLKTAIYLAITLAGVFFTHPTTFVLLSALVGITFAVKSLILFKDNGVQLLQAINVQIILILFASSIFTFGLVAIALLPQLGWVPETNRFLLSTNREVWPKWLSISEYLKAITNPLIFGKGFAYSLDTEKWIPLGITSITLATYGWLKSNKIWKVITTLLGGTILTISMNTISPLYSFLISQDWYVYARVSTRSWFVITVIVILLATHAVNNIYDKYKKIGLLLAVFLIIESTLLSWTYITKPISNDRQIATREIYEYLRNDQEEYRVFCTTRCFSQQDVAQYNLQTVGGYSTLHQKNYYQHAWLLTGTFWDYYTLALPPIGAYKFDQLDPDFASLGEYNTKYVVSPHKLDDPYAILETNIDGYYIYSNIAYSSRVYSYDENMKPVTIPYTRYSAHELVIEPTENSTFTVSEVYTKGWKAFTNNGTEILVLEKPNALISLTVPDNTDAVTLRYSPDEYRYGKSITLITVLCLGTILWKTKKQ